MDLHHPPATETERLKYAVFHDLWLKGYYLTSGLKYGGDYLVYRDDPNKVHSDFIAVVLPWKQPISSIISLGRLGSKVKKNTLLCSVERDGGPVNYVTLQWSGMA
jgi:tRNA-splicing endonuclease subunit Sen34